MVIVVVALQVPTWLPRYKLPMREWSAWEWCAFGLIGASVMFVVIWGAWWERAARCPRCSRRVRRAGRDDDYGYYPCTACGVMWRSTYGRNPGPD